MASAQVLSSMFHVITLKQAVPSDRDMTFGCSAETGSTAVAGPASKLQLNFFLTISFVDKKNRTLTKKKIRQRPTQK